MLWTDVFQFQIAMLAESFSNDSMINHTMRIVRVIIKQDNCSITAVTKLQNLFSPQNSIVLIPSIAAPCHTITSTGDPPAPVNMNKVETKKAQDSLSIYTHYLKMIDAFSFQHRFYYYYYIQCKVNMTLFNETYFP